MKSWRGKLQIAGFMLVIWGVTTQIPAQESSRRVTFFKDVVPVLQENCQMCHRQGGDNIAGMVAPMSLITYREVRPWAKSLAQEVKSRTMPPWTGSEASHGVFANERILPEEDIATLVAWANTGAVAGNQADAPAPLDFSDYDGWQAGTPDIEIAFTEAYFVPDDVEDHYISFRAPIPEELLGEARWLRSIEWRSGSEVVHHIVGSATATLPDGSTQRIGLGSTAPGEEPMDFPEGYGIRLPSGSVIAFSMHYHKEPGPGTGTWDRSSVGFRFWESDDPPIRHAVLRAGLTNGGFEIPPGHPNWAVGWARTFDEDTTLLSLHPHMHLRGKAARYLAIYPDGTVEELLNIPEYDFNWQTDYMYREPKRIPAGTRIEFMAHFDNSTDNPFNPDPTIPMGWGGATTEEMMIGYVNYTNTAPVEFDE